MNKKTIFFLKALLLFCTITFFIFYIKFNYQNFAPIATLSATNFLFISFVVFTNLTLNSVFFLYFYKIFKIKLNFKQNLSLIVAGNLSQYLVPKSGQITRSLYLKKYHHFNHKQYLVLYFLLNIVSIFAVSFLGFLLVFFYWNKFLFFVFSSLNFVSFLLFFFPDLFFKFVKKIEFLDFFKKEWGKIKKNKKQIIFLLFLRVFILLINSFNFYYIYNALFGHIAYFQSIIISVAGALSPLISITPASLGVTEGLSAYTADLLGISFANTVAVILLMRGVGILWNFILALVLGIKNISESSQKSNL